MEMCLDIFFLICPKLAFALLLVLKTVVFEELYDFWNIVDWSKAYCHSTSMLQDPDFGKKEGQ